MPALRADKLCQSYRGLPNPSRPRIPDVSARNGKAETGRIPVRPPKITLGRSAPFPGIRRTPLNPTLAIIRRCPQLHLREHMLARADHGMILRDGTDEVR